MISVKVANFCSRLNNHQFFKQFHAACSLLIFVWRLVIQPVAMFAHYLIPVFLFPGTDWSHHRLAVTNVTCPYCIRMSVNKSNLRIHIWDVHSADKGPFSCVHCGKQVKNRSCLRVHMYRRHSLELQKDCMFHGHENIVVV